MGLFDDKSKLDAIFNKPKKYPSCVLDLNEGEVQAIFNRCLATKERNSEDTTVSSLYFSSMGWNKEDDGLLFDKTQLCKNQKAIKYLYGQLKPIHENKNILTLDDLVKSYQNTVWASEQAYLTQLLYLGSSDKLTILNPLVAKWNGTNLHTPITPTLSPKDPNFPAWWEAHKAEWED